MPTVQGGVLLSLLSRGESPILLKHDAAFQDRMNYSVVLQVLQQHAGHVDAVPRRIPHARAPRPRGAPLAAVGDEARDGDRVLPLVGHLLPVHGERSDSREFPPPPDDGPSAPSAGPSPAAIP